MDTELHVLTTIIHSSTCRTLDRVPVALFTKYSCSARRPERAWPPGRATASVVAIETGPARARRETRARARGGRRGAGGRAARAPGTGRSALYRVLRTGATCTSNCRVVWREARKCSYAAAAVAPGGCDRGGEREVLQQQRSIPHAPAGRRALRACCSTHAVRRTRPLRRQERGSVQPGAVEHAR